MKQRLLAVLVTMAMLLLPFFPTEVNASSHDTGDIATVIVITDNVDDILGEPGVQLISTSKIEHEIDQILTSDIVIFSSAGIVDSAGSLVTQILDSGSLVYVSQQGIDLNRVLHLLPGYPLSEVIEEDSDINSAIYLGKDGNGYYAGTVRTYDLILKDNDGGSHLLTPRIQGDDVIEAAINTYQRNRNEAVGDITPSQGTGNYIKIQTEQNIYSDGDLLGGVYASTHYLRQSETVNGDQHLWSVMHTITTVSRNDFALPRQVGSYLYSFSPTTQTVVDYSYLVGSGGTVSFSLSFSGFSVGASFPQNGMSFTNLNPQTGKYEWLGKKTLGGGDQVLQLKTGLMVLNTKQSLWVNTGIKGGLEYWPPHFGGPQLIVSPYFDQAHVIIDY